LKEKEQSNAMNRDVTNNSAVNNSQMFANANPPPPPVMNRSIETVQEIKKNPEKKPVLLSQAVETGLTDSDRPFYELLQKMLDQFGMNDKNGVKNLSGLPLNSPQLKSLIQQLATLLNISVQTQRTKSPNGKNFKKI
jgi:hypothetical protein